MSWPCSENDYLSSRYKNRLAFFSFNRADALKHTLNSTLEQNANLVNATHSITRKAYWLNEAHKYWRIYNEKESSNWVRVKYTRSLSLNLFFPEMLGSKKSNSEQRQINDQKRSIHYYPRIVAARALLLDLWYVELNVAKFMAPYIDIIWLGGLLLNCREIRNKYPLKPAQKNVTITRIHDITKSWARRYASSPSLSSRPTHEQPLPHIYLDFRLINAIHMDTDAVERENHGQIWSFQFKCATSTIVWIKSEYVRISQNNSANSMCKLAKRQRVQDDYNNRTDGYRCRIWRLHRVNIFCTTRSK